MLNINRHQSGTVKNYLKVSQSKGRGSGGQSGPQKLKGSKYLLLHSMTFLGTFSRGLKWLFFPLQKEVSQKISLMKPNKHYLNFIHCIHSLFIFNFYLPSPSHFHVKSAVCPVVSQIPYIPCGCCCLCGFPGVAGPSTPGSCNSFLSCTMHTQLCQAALSWWPW